MLRPSDLYGRVLTVRGPVEPPHLGSVLSHEHLFIAHSSGYVLDDDSVAKEEAILLRDTPSAIGTENKTVVDLSCTGLRVPSHAMRLRLLSDAASAPAVKEVHVVAGTGYYTWNHQT